ncbi:MAG TPA: bacteriohemerythrin [Rectinemataceae bacterium]|nr:bacteriohemerythrin [Rectinemataceae bacterium]
MPGLEWMPALAVGNAELDEEHKVLFALINRLDEAREADSDRRVLLEVAEELVRYVHVHFSHEEGLFTSNGYPDADVHKEEHRSFVARVAAFHAKVIEGDRSAAAEMVEYLKSWLTRHISASDRKYRPWVSGKVAD